METLLCKRFYYIQYIIHLDHLIINYNAKSYKQNPILSNSTHRKKSSNLELFSYEESFTKNKPKMEKVM